MGRSGTRPYRCTRGRDAFHHVRNFSPKCSLLVLRFAAELVGEFSSKQMGRGGTHPYHGAKAQDRGRREIQEKGPCRLGNLYNGKQTYSP